MAIEYKFGVKVTPALAKKWLEANVEENRNPKQSKIPAYARDMLAGRWQTETGEMIKFNVDGDLIDGQNRLRAVILAGKTIQFDVALNVPHKAMQVLDTGSARSGMDVLKIAGATDRARTASIVRWVILWDAGFFTGHGPLRPTTTEILDRYLQTPEMFYSATRRAGDCAPRALGNSSVAGVAHYLLSRVDQEQAHGFFDQFVSGADLPGKSAVLALRNKLIAARSERLIRPEQLSLYIRAWNFYRKDKPVERLSLTRGELTNLNFPQPK